MLSLSVFYPLIVLGVILLLVNLIPMHPTVKQIINAVAILFIVLWLIHTLFGVGPGVRVR